MPATFAFIFAQVTNAANAAAGAPINPVDAAAQERPAWFMFVAYALIIAIFYFAFFRPQMQASKKKEETVKTAKTGDKIVTSSGIHGVITNVKDSTVIVRVHENVKLEIEKSHIERINRPDSADVPEKISATKA